MERQKESAAKSVNQLLERWKTLSQNGSNEKTDWEFAKVCDELRNVQKLIREKQHARNLIKRYTERPLKSFERDVLLQQIRSFKRLSMNLPMEGDPLLLTVQEHLNSQVDVELLKDELSKGAKSVNRSTDAVLNKICRSGSIVSSSELQKYRETEMLVKMRIFNRIATLEETSSNLLNITDILDSPKESDVHDCKRKALIELKMLRLLKKQEFLRSEVSHCMPQMRSITNAAQRIAYRRLKHSPQETRLTEALERQQRSDRERRQRQRQRDYLQGICSQGREISSRAKLNQTRAQKLSRAVLAYHSHIEKEEQRRAERNAKQRLLALKADDEEAYLKLIDQAKDTRITHLLRQTDQYLDSLAQAVKAQQAAFGEPVYNSELESKLQDSSKKPDYYNVAHNIREVISEQPSILVGGKLKEYQLKGLQWMISLYNNHLNGILADEMGLGKTIQTISLISHLIEKKRQNGPFLIIVPLSTLTNWTMEFEKWAPSITKIVYKGPPMVRKALHQQVRHANFQVLLTTFEYVIKDRPLLSKIKWIYMIIDEGHRMKNTHSKLTNTLTTYYSSRYRLILTGTPLQNNLPELWALLNFVLPRIFNSVKSFDEWFNTPFANAGGQDKMELTEEESLLVIRRLHKVLRPFLLRRLKKDVEAELPDKVERVVRCQMSALQLKLYTQMKKHGMLFVQNGTNGKTGIKGLQNTVMQLKKICNHPFVFEEVEKVVDPSGMSFDMLWRVAGKFELLDRILPKLFKSGHRVLMFFQMTQIMNIMEDYLHYRAWKYLRLDGSTKSDDRSQLLHLFNDPASIYTIFLLSTRAGGLGLNLQTADTVIIFDSDWNPHQDLQAQDRAHRIGQTKEVRIFRLITEKSVEENILARAQYKLDIDGKVIQAGKFDNKSTPEEREAFLRSLLENENSEEDNEEKGELDDDELNEMIARDDNELRMFKQMDLEREMNSPYGKNKIPRLIQLNELPELYQRDEPENVMDQHFEAAGLGRGARRRTPVVYDESIRDEQWLQAIEQETNVRTTRSRSKRGSTHSTTSTQPEKRKRRRGPAPDTLSPEHRVFLRQLCLELYSAVSDLQDETGRNVNELFLELPSKRLYPDYYVIIKQPISLDMIRKHINGTWYKSLEDLIGDFKIMFNNARTYNEEGSFVYEDANRMERAMNEKLEEMRQNGSINALQHLQLAAEALVAMDPPVSEATDFVAGATEVAQYKTMQNGVSTRAHAKNDAISSQEPGGPASMDEDDDDEYRE
ncbi:ATP-dependent DNA helicase Snf21 [Schizosaccharomyces japonicus yFS275]|uniref:ATP-dependent DNA helicase Snf21 n=1 Tax=Schizosaccharomyces japonicus (strain yFS275 / FY16936) TaxID=402676 RepID=B6K7N8_SCHJY|nr:ATP-dependent DNA helicase Snf21 [Schizosaccharomyces japonicus yFS275]EEB09542.2 ATP-dependent DNA helicase Snf21 [Schizosaccharomyces japonicus yFS275]